MTNIADLLTDNLDIWTSAIERRSTAGRGRSKKFSLYGIEKLRALILDLAVRGKLVPQDALEHSDSKLKLTTKHDTISNVSFALPDNWQWVLMDQIGETNIGLTYSPKDLATTGTPVLRSSNVQNDRIDLDDLVRVSSTVRNKVLVQKGDILICVRNGSKALVGKCALIPDLPEPMAFGAFMAVFRSKHSEYVRIFLTSPLFRRLLEGVETTTINQITQANLKNTLLPLPPLAEQHRIVAKVDELMGLCDRLEAGAYDAIAAHQLLVSQLLATLTQSKTAADFAQNWQRIKANFDTLFTTEDSIETLKQTILQLAVMGKLVPQDANDEPASELLKQVRQTRIKIASQQKVRKLKQHSSEKLSAKPFDLPRGWEWATFPELGIFDRGKSKHRPRNDPKLFTPGIHPLVQTGEVARADEYIREFHSEYSDVGLAQSRMWPKGTLCITIAANIADTAILDFDACFPDSVVGFMPFEPIVSPRYFLHFMKTAKADLLKYAPSTAQKNINVGILDSVQIPIPPLNEMIRIVQKVDSLISLCGELKAQLSKAQNQQTQFADAIASRAVA